MYIRTLPRSMPRLTPLSLPQLRQRAPYLLQLLVRDAPQLRRRLVHLRFDGRQASRRFGTCGRLSVPCIHGLIAMWLDRQIKRQVADVAQSLAVYQ